MRRAALRQSELRAVELLCEQGFTSMFDLMHPAVHRFRLPVEVRFDSYGSYCQATGVDRATLFAHAGADGMTIRHGGLFLVLYDEQVENERRRAFTLAHEIGHILLAHDGGEQAAVEEREANAFAAALLAPEVAVRYLAHREHCTITATWLQSAFFLSSEAARYRAAMLAGKRQRPPSAYEITLLLQLFGKLS
jgi:hypothetical protein